MSYSALQRVVANPRALKAYLDEQEQTETAVTQQREGNTHNGGVAVAGTRVGGGRKGVAIAAEDPAVISKPQSANNVKATSGAQRSMDRLGEGSAGGRLPEHSSKEGNSRENNVVLGMDHEAMEVRAIDYPRLWHVTGFNRVTFLTVLLAVADINAAQAMC